jgi:Type II secretory pathway, component PulF
MPDYNYRGVDRTGKQIKGKKSVPDIIALESELAKHGNVLIEAQVLEQKKSGNTNISFFRRGPKNRELIDFFITLRSLLKSSVTFLDALKIIKEDVDSSVLLTIIDDIISNVKAGGSFTEALKRHPKVFSRHILGMIMAGEHSGNLPDTFGELIRYLEWQSNLKSNIKQATIYPLTVLSAVLGLILILFTFVVPTFAKLLNSLNVPLPFPTRMVMSLSEFFVATWWTILLAGFITLFVFRYGQKHWIRFAYAVDSAKLKIWVFGELIRILTISRFAFNFSILFESGVPIIQNLELCEGLVGNKVMENALKEARKDVEGGKFLNESLKKNKIFPAKALLMITVGETSGDLGGALRNLTDYYTEEVSRKIKKVFGIMEPLIMLTLIGIVGFTAMAIMLPILGLFGAVK